MLFFSSLFCFYACNSKWISFASCFLTLSLAYHSLSLARFLSPSCTLCAHVVRVDFLWMTLLFCISGVIDPFFCPHTRTHTSPTTTMCGVHSFRFLYLILYSSALLLLSLSVVAGARHKHHVRTYYLYSSQINPFNMMILLQCSLNASLLHDRHKILCLCKVSRL